MAKRKTPAAKAGSLVGDATAPVGGEPRTVLLKQIDPSPFQTRSEFPEEEIRELADSIRQDGLLQAPIVRERVVTRSGKRQTRYELMGGERRFRACQLLKWRQIRVEVRDVDDRQARRLLFEENDKRQDLDPIAEARQFRQMLDAGDAPGPTELARNLGKSQGHVSNRLRLLELPKGVRKRIISGEIPASHSRILNQFKDHPKLLEETVKDVLGPPGRREPMTGQDFKEEFFALLEDRTEPIDFTRFSSKLHQWLPKPKLTDEERAQLGIVRIDEGDGCKPRDRITNVRLWSQFVDREEQRALERAEKRDGNKKAKPAKKAKPKKLTPAEQKRQQQEEKRRAAEHARQQAWRLWRWYVDWLRCLVAERIRDEASLHEAALVLLAAAGHWDNRFARPGSYRTSFDRQQWVTDAADALKVKIGRDFVQSLVDVETGIEDLAVEAAAHCFYGGDNEHAYAPNPLVPDGDVVTLAKALDVDVERSWLEGQAGPLSEGFWHLHNTQQLRELGKELKVDLPKAGKKADLVAAFVSRIPGPNDKEVGINLPRELKKIKRPKR